VRRVFLCVCGVRSLSLYEQGTIPPVVARDVLSCMRRVAGAGAAQRKVLRETGWVALLTSVLQRYVDSTGHLDAVVRFSSLEEVRARLTAPCTLTPVSIVSSSVFGMLSYALTESGGTYEGKDMSLQAQAGAIKGLTRHLSHANIKAFWASSWTSGESAAAYV